jgi:catechol 2,3-dioxygenase-like lactoylglutathione lyase family enzyme
MTAKANARAVGINHVALEVDDVDAALEFYGALFELKLRGRHDGMAFIDLGDQFINLSPKRTQSPDGARHFGLVVDDRQAVRRALEQLGAEILPGPGLDFLDPWGNHLQVVQYDGIQFPSDYYASYPDLLRRLDLAAVEREAKRLDATQMITVVVGDRARLREQFEGAGYAFVDAAPELTR